MAKTICRLLLGLAVLYAGAVTAFAFLHYEGDRPGAGAVLADFHGWLGLGGAAPEPETPPAPSPAAPSEPTPPTAPPDSPPPAQPQPAAHTVEDEAEDLAAAEKALKAAETSAKELRAMGRGPDFDGKLRETLGLLGTCREILNHILEQNPEQQRANRLWDRLQAIHAAVKHY